MANLGFPMHASCLLAQVAGRRSPTLRLPIAAIGLASLLPSPAQAHVKWFVTFDLTQPPLPIAAVLTATFFLLLAGFTALVCVGFALDRLLLRQPRFAQLTLGRHAGAEERILRAGVGASFIALFAAGGTLLTPEMTTTVGWVGTLQFAIAACMLGRRSCALGGAGILGLYVYAACCYGLLHVTDYLLYLGLASYLVFTAFDQVRLRALRMPVLYVCVCGSLMWAAVEKWIYPHWLYPLLEAHPYLTLGVPPDLVVVVAGFVEFALSFYILTGLGLLRPAVLALMAILTAAVPEFGKVDAIGHLPLLTALAAMFLHGPTQLHRWFHAAGRHPASEGGRAGSVFMACAGLFIAAYYGMWTAERGTSLASASGVTLAAQATPQHALHGGATTAAR